MYRFFLRRLWYSILVLWGAATLVFILFHVLPGNPARLTSGAGSDPAAAAAARKSLHLDKRVLTRYGLYLNDLSPVGVTSAKRGAEGRRGFHITRLDDSSFVSLKAPYLGRSLVTKRDVGALLGQSLPDTIFLVLAALLIAGITGISLGILAALKRGTVFDTGPVAASLAGSSLPVFFVGLIIAYACGVLPGSLPGMSISGSRYATGGPAIRSLILPAIALGIRPMAGIISLTRSAMLHVLSRDYIRTAYAKGLSKPQVLLRHALSNVMIPVVSAVPGWLAELLAGAFFMEAIFGRKGIGSITVDAFARFDVPLVIGAMLLTAFLLILAGLLTDLLRGWIDPRVKMQQEFPSVPS